MDTQSEPFLSVVLPVYNGGVTIGRALNTLLAQDYPRHKYELIVVNDGSTDDTAEVVATFPDVRYIELSRNMGIPSAQNAGLEAAKGDIYVAFNDDFQAAPDFLSKLANAYTELSKPLGVGGAVAKDSSSPRKGLMAKFIEANRVGAAPNVVNLRLPFTPNVIKRLLTYVVTNFSQDQYIESDEAGTQEVVELYGANASFPISKLREVGGWDVTTAAPAIGGIEDRDVCYRLRQRFPDHHFYVARSARLMMDLDANDSSVSIRSYLLRPYRRGPFNYVFHIKNGITPPVFPFPPLILLALLAGAILTPLLLPLWIVVLPQICYGWWARRAVAERRPIYLLFPYLQVAEEAMVLTGLLKGAMMHATGKLAIS